MLSAFFNVKMLRPTESSALLRLAGGCFRPPPGVGRLVHDVAHLFHKKGVGGELEVFLQVRLESEGPPDADDGVLVVFGVSLMFFPLCARRFHKTLRFTLGRKIQFAQYRTSARGGNIIYLANTL